MRSWFIWVPWLALTLIAALAIFQWQRAKQALLLDAQLVLQIQQLRSEANAAKQAALDARDKADQAEARATQAMERAKALDADLVAARQKLKALPKPQTLAEAQAQIETCHAAFGACEARLNAELEVTVNLREALSELRLSGGALELRAEALEKAWRIERERVDACQKSGKQQKRRAIIGYVGAGTLGTLTGLGVSMLVAK
jgi:hypothetical protein